MCFWWVKRQDDGFYCLILSQQWGRFPSRRTRLPYEWRTILCYPLLQPPLPSHFLLSLSSTSPLLPCCSSNWCLEVWRKQGGGWKQSKWFAVYLWKRTQRSGTGEALNVAVAAMLGMRASALPGLDRRSPQLYLRKWQSGAHQPLSLPLHFSVCLSLGSKPPPPFLPCTRMIIIFLCGRKVYFRTCWEEGEHTYTHKDKSVHTHTHTQAGSSVLVVWFG